MAGYLVFRVGSEQQPDIMLARSFLCVLLTRENYMSWPEDSEGPLTHNLLSIIKANVSSEHDCNPHMNADKYYKMTT